MATLGDAGMNGQMESVTLRLLGRFDCHLDGRRIAVAPRGRRLLALLALEGGTLSRRVLGETLWPDGSRSRQTANLRGVLFRLPPALRATMDTGEHVGLGPSWSVDYHEARELAATGGDGAAPGSSSLIDLESLLQQLLPEWDEPWVDAPRRQFEDLRLRALEAIARRDHAAGRPAYALAAAEAALTASPARETAARLVVQIHLDQGNVEQAAATAADFTAALRGEHGIEPTAAFRELVDLP